MTNTPPTPTQFSTYTDATDWVETRAASYGGKRKFFASDEYRAAYPAIQASFEATQKATGNALRDQLKAQGRKHGDKVTVQVGSTLFGPVKRQGWLDLDGDAPAVHLDAPYLKTGAKRAIRTVKDPRIIPE